MTNMAAMPIYGKNRKKIFSGTERPMTLKRGMQDRVLEFYQVKTIDFSETIVVKVIAYHFSLVDEVN